jgi:hypothetical protein
VLELLVVNRYLAHKQHLLPSAQPTGIVQVTRDVVALHATGATGPYLSLWARAPGFQRKALEEALYERRELARVLCMRTTLHVVPSEEVAFFLRAYTQAQLPAELRDPAPLLVQAGLCPETEAGAALETLHQQVLDVLAEKGPATVREISLAVPQLQARVRHSVGKSYEGEFSLGSRLVPAMCAQGLLIRARPRGTWRSNLYEYASLSGWLPDADLASTTPQEARTWLVRRYLAAFGPATFDDVQWWTGFSKRVVQAALQPLKPEVVEVAIEGLGEGYLMLADDVRRLRGLATPDSPYAFFLPSLDPYVMGYRHRRRFLAPEHRAQVFDRAGNAMPTVWLDGRVVGAWGQRKDGTVVYGLFEPVGEEEPLLEAKRRQLEAFLDGEYLPQRSHTPFTRTLA